MGEGPGEKLFFKFSHRWELSDPEIFYPALAAAVCAEHGITAERVSYETIRDALKRLGVGWRRAKTWITIGGGLCRRGLVEPLGAAGPARLGRDAAAARQTRAKDDPQPKALACYGLLRTDQDRVLLRFVEGRPVSRVTTTFLAWGAGRLAE